ncbi:MAG: AbrB/MazE/SpoVT family DNA-binding domain-containing protein [Synergistaceae bacterium]|nr:AbrB/MazE/SpoVT family DNA-binding domain-containing protein [Synergistaceae bacterium]
MDTARLSSKGQVTIPVGIRRRLGLRAGENVVFIEQSGNVSITSERRIGFTVSDTWSEEYIEKVMRFGESQDPTFFEQPELPFADRGELFD